jgi:hypothetical protein
MRASIKASRARFSVRYDLLLQFDIVFGLTPCPLSKGEGEKDDCKIYQK